MRFYALKDKLNEYLVFSLTDIKKIDKSFYRSRLNEWQGKGYIKKIRRGYYMFADRSLNEAILFSIANKIYSPSYVSLEMALSHHGFIPEGVYEITSVTSNKTKFFTTKIGIFLYRHLKPSLLFGYEIIASGKTSFKLAGAEKAFLDFLYFNPHLKTAADFSELRINEEEFRLKTNREKLLQYLNAFDNKNLADRVKKFLKYLNYAGA